MKRQHDQRNKAGTCEDDQVSFAQIQQSIRTYSLGMFSPDPRDLHGILWVWT